MKSYPIIKGYILKMGNTSSSKASQCFNSKDFPGWNMVTGRGTKRVSNVFWTGFSLSQKLGTSSVKVFLF